MQDAARATINEVDIGRLGVRDRKVAETAVDRCREKLGRARRHVTRVRVGRVVVVAGTAVHVVDGAVVVEVLQVVIVAVDVEGGPVLLQEGLQVGDEIRSGAVLCYRPDGVWGRGEGGS